MSETLERLKSFEKSWSKLFRTGVYGAFHCAAREPWHAAPARVADAFVAECGYAPIGIHWEMLDPTAGRAGDRSALGAFEDALANDMVMQTRLLGCNRALDCGREFLAAFEASQVTILTNHIVREAGRSEAWTPISDATFEWAFVGYDDSTIALLLLMAED